MPPSAHAGRRRLTLGAVGSRWAPSAHAGRRRLTLGAVRASSDCGN
ncbi:hypothetical protein BZL29_2261 [Mycobacterium kansasii]|uniref:Uncharacterized protein n=1 Tax=Mycobacterium kansasii TaxID=1768 RepID=A0A1V3XN19_MYCKA|nr:hypothetical protein BZL29_2261 [Mycobacterium kansasii]